MYYSDIFTLSQLVGSTDVDILNDLSDLKLQKTIEYQCKAEDKRIKKLSLSNSLSFDKVLPRNILIIIFGYTGEDNIRISRAIALGQSGRPNISTRENCILYVEQLSKNSCDFKQFLILFRKLHPDDQESILNNISVDEVVRLFHIPKKMERRLKDGMTGVSKSVKLEKKSWSNPKPSFLVNDPFYLKSIPSNTNVSRDTRTKLQKFDETIQEYNRITKINSTENRRVTGIDKLSKSLTSLNKTTHLLSNHI